MVLLVLIKQTEFILMRNVYVLLYFVVLDEIVWFGKSLRFDLYIVVRRYVCIYGGYIISQLLDAAHNYYPQLYYTHNCIQH